MAGAQIFENSTDATSYSYDKAKRKLVSYDTPNIIKIKTKYINSKGLAGSMFWEVGPKASTDFPRTQNVMVPLLAFHR